MPRISKDPVERKQEIIETAFSLFSERGYENTTIQNIAEKMNVAQGLCYRYFKSKQELFYACSDYYARKAIRQMRWPIRKDGSVVEKFNDVISSFISYSIKFSEFETSNKIEVTVSTQQIQHLAFYFADALIPIVEQGIKEGVFHCEDVTNTMQILTFGIIHLLHFNKPKCVTRDYVESYIPTIKTVCRNLLRTDDKHLGENLI